MTIDELQIEIRARAEGASKNVDKLVGSLQQLTSAVKKTAKLPEVPKQMGEMAKSAKKASDAMKKSASGFEKFASSLKRIMMYRVVRAILSNIANAAKEGIKNLTEYSKAIGGVDASHASATMSQFASISLQVKNTLGAALMPILNALLPVVQAVANVFIAAANAVNMFFAALSGGVWTKAKAVAGDLADEMGKAGGAAKDLKNAMLGIDELNVISPNSGGGGGGMSGFADMFEEGVIPPALQKFVEGIKKIFTDAWEGVKASGALDRLSDAWRRLKDAVKDFWETPAVAAMSGWVAELISQVLELAGILVVDALASVANILADIVELVSAIFRGDLVGVVNSLKNLLADIVMLPFGLVADVIDAIFGTDVRGWLDGVAEAVRNFDLAAWFAQSWEKIKLVWNNAPGWFGDNVITPLQNAFATTKDKIFMMFDNLQTQIKAAFKGVARWFKENVTEPIGNFFKDTINAVIRALNAMISGLNKVQISLPDWGILGNLAGKTYGINIPSIPYLASGGFPATGELFIAREAGPEMVGTMGGRTAVANNQQIEAGIEEAAYRGFRRALADADDGGGGASFNVYLDGRQVDTSVRKTQRDKGAGIMTGGVIFA